MLETTYTLSVILPVYNVANYLNRSINSLLNQTLKDLEIILVDDGSTDSSGEICDEYVRKYPEKIKCIHQRNKGVSAARNAGLDIAQGKYIGFLDPDDFADEDMYEFLYRGAVETNADIVACSWRDCFANETTGYAGKRYNDTVDIKIAMMREIKDGIYLTWNKIFSAQCIKMVRYQEEYINGEDRLFVIQSLLNANKVTYKFEDKYNYYHRINSAGTKKFTEKDYTLLEVCKKITDIFLQYNSHDIAIAKRQEVLAKVQLLFMMDLAIKMYEPYGKKIILSLRRDWHDGIVKNTYFSQMEKIKFTFLMINPYIYRVLRKILHRIKKLLCINKNIRQLNK